MDNWFKSRWFVLAVSLAFAILLFVFVNAEGNTVTQQSELRFFGDSSERETIENVPVDIKKDDADDYVVEGVPEHVSLKLVGPGSSLMQTIQLENYSVFVDLTGLGAGEHTVDLEYEGISGDLEVYLEPKKATVTIEERSTEEFDIGMEYVNEDKLPEGYELGDYEINPSTVTITSSEGIIEKIAMVKAVVDVEGVTEPIDNREVPVRVYDAQGSELRTTLDPENVVVSVDVHNPSKNVPVNVSTSGEPPEGVRLVSANPEEDEVEIYARSSILDDIDSVSTEDIALDELEKSSTLDVPLDLPEGVTTPGEEETIGVDITLEATKTMEAIPIQIENEADGQSVSFIDPEEGEMAIEVTGDPEDVDRLTQDDLTITVDASGLDEGEHRLQVNVEGPEEVDISDEMDEVTIEVE